MEAKRIGNSPNKTNNNYTVCHIQQHLHFMEALAWNKASQYLIILSLTISLPPVRVIFIDYMQDIALFE